MILKIPIWRFSYQGVPQGKPRLSKFAAEKDMLQIKKGKRALQEGYGTKKEVLKIRIF
jgi:hypothetical protein